MKTRELILLSILILLIPIYIYFLTKADDIGDLGSLLGAFAGLIAIIWFYRGLRLQSIQIEEQRVQFLKQHHLQYQDSLLTFLIKASERMENSHSNLIKSLNIPDASHLASTYLSSLIYYKQALENKDPNIVMSQIKEWMKIEGPCVNFMSSVKDIIILHKKRLGLDDRSEDIDPAEYVYINGSHLMGQPFMSSYKNSVNMLSEQMTLIVPGRNAMILASSAAMAQLVPENIIKKDRIIEEIKKARADGKLVPKICDAIYC